MDKGPFSTPRAPGEGSERAEVSYLVRFWLEPREMEGEASPFRGYARDLRSGEERFFSDPRRLAELILRQLNVARREQADSGEPRRVEDLAG